jgi:CRISPR system Cascade subunit CasA
MVEENKFNLTTDPWIKVLNHHNEVECISLIDLFQNINKYTKLAGEMKIQDFSILRFLLAILTTVYSRFDAQGKNYDWINAKASDSFDDLAIDYDEFYSGDLVKTWIDLMGEGTFSDIVVQYLKKHRSDFDFFGQVPFYQVTKEEYNQLVVEKKQINPTRQVSKVGIRQLNRVISESANKKNIFSQKTDDFKDVISIDELIRWVITYQNYAGSAEKNKTAAITTPKGKKSIHVSSGWLYQVNSVFIDEGTLFKELMMNLVLADQTEEYHVQRPCWEFHNRKKLFKTLNSQISPDNISELYTRWSRAFYIEFDDKTPQVFAAAFPAVSGAHVYEEPMALVDKNGKVKTLSTDKLDQLMWQNFGEYVGINNSQSGILKWQIILKNAGYKIDKSSICLATVGLFYTDSKAKKPEREIYSSMILNLNILLDDETKKHWLSRINELINVTQKVGIAYKNMLITIAALHHASWKGKQGKFKESDQYLFADYYTKRFFEGLNYPFLIWLQNLSPTDNLNEKEKEWKHNVLRLIKSKCEDVQFLISPQDGFNQAVEDKKIDYYPALDQKIKFKKEKQETNVYKIFNQFYNSMIKYLYYS